VSAIGPGSLEADALDYGRASAGIETIWNSAAQNAVSIALAMFLEFQVEHPFQDFAWNESAWPVMPGIDTPRLSRSREGRLVATRRTRDNGELPKR
jgi:hypothetical protein